MKIIFEKNNILILLTLLFGFERKLLARPYSREVEELVQHFNL